MNITYKNSFIPGTILKAATMKKMGIIVLVLSVIVFAAFTQSEAKRKNYYRTFEIIQISEKGITLQDNDIAVIILQSQAILFDVNYIIGPVMIYTFCVALLECSKNKNKNKNNYLQFFAGSDSRSGSTRFIR